VELFNGQDWFLVGGERLGRVLGVEMVCGPAVRDDAVSFTADIDLRPGDILTGHIPMAG